MPETTKLKRRYNAKVGDLICYRATAIRAERFNNNIYSVVVEDVNDCIVIVTSEGERYTYTPSGSCNFDGSEIEWVLRDGMQMVVKGSVLWEY